MRVDQAMMNVPGLKVNNASTKSTKSSGGADGVSEISSATDEVQISKSAQEIASSSSASSVFDASKVASIKTAISEGRFKVNSEMVADGLIATVRDLIQSRSSKA